MSDFLRTSGRNSASIDFHVCLDTGHSGTVGLGNHTDIGPQNVNRMFA